MKEVQREREFFHPLMNSLNGCQGQSCADMKLGSGSFSRVLHTDTGTQALSIPGIPCTDASLGWKPGAGPEAERAGLQHTATWAGRSLVPRRGPNNAHLTVLFQVVVEALARTI